MRHPEPPLPDLARGLRDHLRRPVEAPRPARTAADALPTKTPAENLELLSVVNPARYRGVCELLKWAMEQEWNELATIDARQAAVAEVDRRREAVKGGIL